MKYPVFRTHVSFFFESEPPQSDEGWSIEAFRDYCIGEMSRAGFDLEEKIFCRYNPETGEVTFWQEPDPQLDPLCRSGLLN